MNIHSTKSAVALLLSAVIIITTTTTTTHAFVVVPKKTSPLVLLFGVKWDPTQTAAEVEEDKVFVEFPTPAQRRTLKKAVTKLQARKELATLVLSSEDGGLNNDVDVVAENDIMDGDDDEEEEVSLFQTAVLQQIWELMDTKQTEVVQVRGLSRHNKKLVFQAAEQLCWELEDYRIEEQRNKNNNAQKNENENETAEKENDDSDDSQDVVTVSLLSTKGHAAILYCPTVLDLDHPNKIVLRTSVGQKNVWKARVKAPRDNRGQVIPV
eukprot:CAMPEP_0117068798 /NCGR_PEP_ID=MMETSP0472-20121206/48226_1 /TAXON_ID=693140 ORGANISM="Tiarina fusus, Strain LIS" /NCGR_SAMPLE_ID=MMETSP0472 /ASSEMBLY_ACC=CAM_ASM_000603 /LENGTH=266 /DNA_ID=CAMNT_0004791023 /DNA_START=172 /DNA_END=968 /DNA_ORIENTATION=+